MAVARGLVLFLACTCACSAEERIRLLVPPSASASDSGVHPPDAETPPPSTPRDGLVVRYDFEGTGTTVIDRAGDADATLVGGAMLDGSGSVDLDGDDDYVNMPNGLLSPLSSVTLAAFLTWRGGLCWQRVLDFGSNSGGEDAVGQGLTSLYLTPLSCGNRVLFASFEIGAAHYGIATDAVLPSDVPVFLALTFDAPSGELTLYLDGELAGQIVVPVDLSQIDDVNNWLGRSQWVQDYANLDARYDEFRLYDRALGPDEVAAMHARGPDAP